MHHSRRAALSFGLLTYRTELTSTKSLSLRNFSGAGAFALLGNPSRASFAVTLRPRGAFTEHEGNDIDIGRGARSGTFERRRRVRANGTADDDPGRNHRRIGLYDRAPAGCRGPRDARRPPCDRRTSSVGVQPYNHVIVTGSYALNGRFYATAIRSYESREFAFRARITSVDGNRVGMIRQDNGRPFVVDDTPAIAAHRAYGVHPGTLVVVEGKYGSDHLFRANRIEYVR